MNIKNITFAPEHATSSHHHMLMSFYPQTQRKQYICLFFIPSFTQSVIFAPSYSLCAHSPLQKMQNVIMATKVQTIFFFLYKSLKYTTRLGKKLIWKTYTLKYFQLKIANNYHLHFAIFNNLFFTKLFLWKSLFNRNSWLKLSKSIYGFCKQSTTLLARYNANEKSLLSFTWGEMEHMQLQKWSTNSNF